MPGNMGWPISLAIPLTRATIPVIPNDYIITVDITKRGPDALIAVTPDREKILLVIDLSHDTGYEAPFYRSLSP